MAKTKSREDFTCVEVDNETLDYLKSYFKEVTASKALKKALDMFCKFDPEHIKALEKDREFAYQMPDRMKHLLCVATKQKNWHNAVNDAVVAYLDKKYPSVK
jgi:hypothetical protein